MYGNPYYAPYDGYEEYLEHFGIKGMKWGIRRTPAQLGHKKAKKQRTPEQQAKFEARKRKAVKIAKTTAKYATRAALIAAASYFGGELISSVMHTGMSSLNSVSGQKLISKGSLEVEKILTENVEVEKITVEPISVEPISVELIRIKQARVR